jgi:NTP pyrophosphatase (non-canonical NTP hydrolase)
MQTISEMDNESNNVEKDFKLTHPEPKQPTVVTFDSYEETVMPLAKYPLIAGNVLYPVMGLAGEAGETLDKVKKHWRNKSAEVFNYALIKNEAEREQATLFAMASQSMTPELKKEILKELGDVLWYIAATAKELGYRLQDVAQLNVEKLTDRNERGTILSRGDNR